MQTQKLKLSLYILLSVFWYHKVKNKLNSIGSPLYCSRNLKKSLNLNYLFSDKTSKLSPFDSRLINKDFHHP